MSNRVNSRMRKGAHNFTSSVNNFSPAISKKQSTPLKPGSQMHAPSVPQVPRPLQPVSPLHWKVSKHWPFTKGCPPGQELQAFPLQSWKMKNAYTNFCSILNKLKSRFNSSLNVWNDVKNLNIFDYVIIINNMKSENSSWRNNL